MWNGNGENEQKKLGQTTNLIGWNNKLNCSVHNSKKAAVFFRFLLDEKTSMNICFSQ